MLELIQNEDMAETDKNSFPNVTHYTHVDVQPGGINIQHVEHFHQADILKALGIELEIKDKQAEESPNGRTSQRGPRKQCLFTGGKQTEEDGKVKNEEKQRFMRYLSEHNLKSRKLTCVKTDTLNDVVTCFVIRWRDMGLTAKEPSGGAIFRFLTEECNLQTEVAEQSYSNEIKERLRNKDFTVGTMQRVNQYFNP